MTGERTLPLGGPFLAEYVRARVQSEYEFHAIGSDVEAGLIDPQLRDEALDRLQSCVEDPPREFVLNLELRPADKYAMGADASEDDEQPMEAWAAISTSNMPASAERLAARLFELTGASVARDDLNNNPSH